jgi:hypothetical protein
MLKLYILLDVYMAYDTIIYIRRTISYLLPKFWLRPLTRWTKRVGRTKTIHRFLKYGPISMAMDYYPIIKLITCLLPHPF